jgi:hypothetical protein
MLPSRADHGQMERHGTYQPPHRLPLRRNPLPHNALPPRRITHPPLAAAAEIAVCLVARQLLPIVARQGLPGDCPLDDREWGRRRRPMDAKGHPARDAAGCPSRS